MDKHAYCIIAHNEPVLLEILVRMIDDARNDIYILLDSKVQRGIFERVKANHSALRFVPASCAVDIRWGDLSQVQAELTVLKEAYQHGVYLYYHLISGVDLPIKSQDYIHNFMRNNYPKEFVGYTDVEGDAGFIRRISKYHLFCKCQKDRNPFLKYTAALIRKSFLCLQSILGIQRRYDMELRKGANWCSITQEFCAYLLSKESYILKAFKYITCVDEVFLHSILWNSNFRKNIYDIADEYGSCMREIDWKRGNPYVWKNEDYEYLMKSEKLFARKFSSQHLDIVQKLYESIAK